MPEEFENTLTAAADNLRWSVVIPLQRAANQIQEEFVGYVTTDFVRNELAAINDALEAFVVVAEVGLGVNHQAELFTRHLHKLQCGRRLGVPMGGGGLHSGRLPTRSQAH